MTKCPECGFDLFTYNSSTYTCKHGHRYSLDGTPAPIQPTYTPEPADEPTVRVPFVPANHQPLAVAALAGAAAAVIVDVVVLLLA